MSDINRVSRGGSWPSSAGYCRSAYRGRVLPSDRFSGLGFRVVKETKPDMNCVFRGGSWSSTAEFCRSAYRGGFYPSSRYDFIGFRVVKGEIDVK